MTFLFWFSLFMILYAYAGYPALLWLIARVRDRREQVPHGKGKPHQPRASMIISAYNEAEVMEEKILNSLALDYPREKLEIVVVSDGSEDGTDDIVKRYAGRGIVLKRYDGRLGKTECLNRTVPLLSGEIVVFSDANSQYERSAVSELADLFDDRQVGFVTGATRYVAADNSGVTGTVSMYTRIEQITKELESMTGSCVGADGAIFAIRRELYPPLRPADINDLVIPLSIVKRGLRGVFAGTAFCRERTAKDAQGEFLRQVRITNRTLRALMHYRELFNPFQYGFFSFQLFSHKLCKFMVPFFLVSLFVSSALLAANGAVYGVAFAGQAFFYIFGNTGVSNRYGALPAKILSFSHTFQLVNAAILKGWVKFIQGETFTTWNTSR